MPLLFREIAFCDCGRPALLNGSECRTCYEDAVRRRWRDESLIQGSRGAAAAVVLAPIKMIKPRLRVLFSPSMTEEDVEREMCKSCGPA